MREILFRGKIKECENINAVGEWVIGELTTDIDGSKWIGQAGSKSYMVDGETVGQYTGLKDRKRRKIFEGDIIRYFDDDDKEYEDSKIMWDSANARFVCEFDEYGEDLTELDLFTVRGSEVIGNIYDGKEE